MFYFHYSPKLHFGFKHKILFESWYIKIQWNLVITRSLGPWKLPCYVRFVIISGEKTKQYKELGPAKLPCYKRVLLYPTSL